MTEIWWEAHWREDSKVSRLLVLILEQVKTTGKVEITWKTMIPRMGRELIRIKSCSSSFCSNNSKLNSSSNTNICCRTTSIPARLQRWTKATNSFWWIQISKTTLPQTKQKALTLPLPSSSCNSSSKHNSYSSSRHSSIISKFCKTMAWVPSLSWMGTVTYKSCNSSCSSSRIFCNSRLSRRRTPRNTKTP